MSRELRQKRTARRARLFSGLSYSRALQYARDGLITSDRPLPDAVDTRQQAFEAAVLHALVEGFPDSRQVPQGFLGIAAVRPRPADLTLHLDPEVAPAVLAALIPTYDHDYGGLRGAPGFRLRRRGRGCWQAYSAAHPSSTAVQIVAREEVLADAYQAIADIDDGPQLGTGPGLTRAEQEELDFRERLAWVGAGNLLLSRVLRRILLINLVGRSHGLVNLYCHHYAGLVFEWCCGPDVAWVAKELRDAGLLGDARTDTPEVADIRRSGRPSYTLELSHEAYVTLRRNQALHGSYEQFGEPAPASPARNRARGH
ncbi:hypothetical protein [Micromonospora lupini]|uniref:hypothetical protein n=1 Tax=Micromonospora lupini TaxID=285679 RepID=UPI0033D65CDD